MSFSPERTFPQAASSLSEKASSEEKVVPKNFPKSSLGKKALSRNPEVDILRILCASALFNGHAQLVNGQWAIPNFNTWITGIFIGLAGFSAVRFSHHREELRNGNYRKWPAFVFDRFLSFYPAYAAITLLIFLGSFLHPAANHTTAFSFSDLLCNLLMVNQYIGKDYFSAPMWFAPFILQVYLLIPVLCLLTRWPKTGLVLCTVISTTASLGVYAVDPQNANEICRSWSPLFRLTFVFFGITLGMASSPAQLPGIFLTVGLCALAKLSLIAVFPAMEVTLLRPAHALTALLVLITAAILLAKILRSLAPSLQRGTTLLGQASLPFFLGHTVLMNFLCDHFGNNPWIWAGYFLFCWAGAVVFTLVYRSAIKALRHRLVPRFAPLPA